MDSGEDRIVTGEAHGRTGLDGRWYRPLRTIEALLDDVLADLGPARAGGPPVPPPTSD